MESLKKFGIRAGVAVILINLVAFAIQFHDGNYFGIINLVTAGVVLYLLHVLYDIEE